MDLLQICRHHSVQVAYICLMSGRLKHDHIRATPTWRGSTSGRYDCAIINGENHFDFVKIFGFFMLSSGPTTWHIALVHRYQYIGRHRSSGYIQLADDGQMDIIFADTIIRLIHILPTSRYNPYLTVQDVTPDIYLRLKKLN